MPPVSSTLIIGCGYLGARVGARLLAGGARVTATTTRPERLPELERLGFRPAILDLSRPEESSAWSVPSDAAVYAVAPGRRGDPRVAFGEGPVECARRLIDGRWPLPGRFILISSTGVYSEREGGWVDEESPADPEEEKLRRLRGAEEALRDLAARRGFPSVILRLGGIYGPGRSPVGWLRRPEMRERIARGHREGRMNWIRVEDAAEAILLAMEMGRPGEIYNIVDGEPVRRADFYAAAAARAGVDLPELGTSGDLGKRCSGRKAREELGFTPRFRTYREGLAEL